MSDTWPSLPAQASANCYLDKHIASTSSESKYYIALMQKSDVRNRVDVADVGLHSQHRQVLIACIDQHIASTEGGNTTIDLQQVRKSFSQNRYAAWNLPLPAQASAN